MTLASASALDKEISGGTKTETARELLVKLVAERAAEKKASKKVVFDRGGYLYHGRVQALAEVCS